MRTFMNNDLQNGDTGFGCGKAYVRKTYAVNVRVPQVRPRAGE